jgi:hypothetical protein
MQHREELRHKGHNRSKKRHVTRGGNISFSEGRGDKYVPIVFGPKYRTLR